MTAGGQQVGYTLGCRQQLLSAMADEERAECGEKRGCPESRDQKRIEQSDCKPRSKAGQRRKPDRVSAEHEKYKRQA